jgi:hypothetical protein
VIIDVTLKAGRNSLAATQGDVFFARTVPQNVKRPGARWLGNLMSLEWYEVS